MVTIESMRSENHVVIERHEIVSQFDILLSILSSLLEGLDGAQDVGFEEEFASSIC